MERLLTKEDIHEITENASSFPIFNRPILLIGPKNYKTLIGKSPKNGLIMIEGNEDTGFKHIQKRHAYKYEYKEWKRDKPNELDFPTVFPEDELLFLNWQKIADTVYKSENFDLEKNNDPEKFDLFFGDYQYDGERYKCILILYKDTKIIHTFYLSLNKNKKVFNKKKPSGFHFVKEKIECLLDYGNRKQILKIPFANNENEIKYLVDIQWDMVTFNEEWKIIIYRIEKNFIFLWRKGNLAVSLNKRLSSITSDELDNIEKEIGKINKLSSEEIEAKCSLKI